MVLLSFKKKGSIFLVNSIALKMLPDQESVLELVTSGFFQRIPYPTIEPLNYRPNSVIQVLVWIRVCGSEFGRECGTASLELPNELSLSKHRC